MFNRPDLSDTIFPAVFRELELASLSDGVVFFVDLTNRDVLVLVLLHTVAFMFFFFVCCWVLLTSLQ